MEVIGEGIQWTEGPVWIRDGGFLLFSDVLTNTIHRWDREIRLHPFIIPSGYTGSMPRGAEMGSNGLNVDRQGRLLLCQHGDRRVARLDPPLDSSRQSTKRSPTATRASDSTARTILSFIPAARFISPIRPMAWNSKWTIRPRKCHSRACTGSRPDGKVTLLTKEMERPNGIGFSPDEKTLYVANSHGPRMIVDGVPRGAGRHARRRPRVFRRPGQYCRKWNRGSADGMAIDQHGNVWATAPGGVAVISPEGKHLGSLITTQRTANCKFGEDGSTLFIAADDYFLRIRLTTKGDGILRRTH